MNNETLKLTARRSADNFRKLVEEHADEIVEAIIKNSDAGEKRMTITHKLVLDLQDSTMNDKLSFSVATSDESGVSPMPDPNQPELFEP